MQPWMIIAGLMTLGVLTLLVAPRIHRRSTQKAIAAATSHRSIRAEELARLPASVEHKMLSVEKACQARDALLLRGVRSAVRSENGVHSLIVEEVDDRVIAEVMSTIQDRPST